MLKVYGFWLYLYVVIANHIFSYLVYLYTRLLDTRLYHAASSLLCFSLDRMPGVCFLFVVSI